MKSSEERKRWVFRCCLKLVRDSEFRMGVGSSFHQPGTVNENVLESDFVPFCDGTTRRRLLARRSQTSWGDVDCYKWMEVAGCWACGCSIYKHQCLELDASCNREPVQGDKERCDMGPFGFEIEQFLQCGLWKSAGHRKLHQDFWLNFMG